MNPVQAIKENGKYYFTFKKNGNFIKYEVFPDGKKNASTIEVNGTEYAIKPIPNIVKFEVFCIETNLIK